MRTDTPAQFFFAAIVIYNLGQIVTKTSFLLQYRRIFQDKFTRTTCLVFLVFLGIWGVVLEVLLGLACTPVAVFFPSREAICINTLTVWYLTSVMNIVTDFLVFLIPMPAIRALQLRRKQKILVTSVFCLGFLYVTRIHPVPPLFPFFLGTQDAAQRKEDGRRRTN